MTEAARWANSEEDIRYECNKLIDGFLGAAKISVKGRHEYGLAGGFIDSMYAGVIIEYKDPKGPQRLGERLNSLGVVAVVNQIRKRFRDFERHELTRQEKLFGVGMDGATAVFVRKRGGKFAARGPCPVPWVRANGLPYRVSCRTRVR
jgi:hypothetical protein